MESKKEMAKDTTLIFFFTSMSHLSHITVLAAAGGAPRLCFSNTFLPQKYTDGWGRFWERMQPSQLILTDQKGHVTSAQIHTLSERRKCGEICPWCLSSTATITHYTSLLLLRSDQRSYADGKQRITSLLAFACAHGLCFCLVLLLPDFCCIFPFPLSIEEGSSFGGHLTPRQCQTTPISKLQHFAQAPSSPCGVG